MTTIKSFKDLQVWNKAMNLIPRIYEITRSYPEDERFGLISETRKTSRSIPSNIAEGRMRVSPKEYRRFVSIALGSAGELQTQVLIGERLGYLTNEIITATERDVEEIQRMLRGLEQSLA